MGDGAPGTVLHSGRKDREVAGTGKQEKRAITKKAGVPVLQIMAGKEFAFEVDEAFIVHGLRRFRVT